MRSSMWVSLVGIMVIGCTGRPFSPSRVDITFYVLTTTRGLHQPEGYTLFIDGAGHAVPANGWSYHDTDGREHTLLLGNVAPNCKVMDPNPRQTGVYSVGGDYVIEFHVNCDWNAMARVTVHTTGANYDPARVWSLYASWGWLGQPPEDVPVNGSRTFGPVFAGEYTIRLGVAENCQVSGENPRSVMLVHEQVVESIFEVTCS